MEVHLRKAGGAEKLSCDVITTKASADPTGSSGAGMALQNRPKLKQGDWVLHHYLSQLLAQAVPP